MTMDEKFENVLSHFTVKQGFYIAVLLYGILITVMKGFETEVIRKDINSRLMSPFFGTFFEYN